MSYSLPPALQLIDVAPSPMADEAEQQTRAWLESLGLTDSVKAIHQLDIYLPGKYAAFMWPHANAQTLNVLSDLTGWFSCQDDLADEDLSCSPDALERALRQVHEVASERGAGQCAGLPGGLRDIIRRAGASMPEQWVRRTLDQYSSYLFCCVSASTHRLGGTQPGLADYESVWRNAGGFQVCFEFTYFAHQINLPATVYYCSLWQELRRLSLNLMKAVNDVLSFCILANPDEDVYNLLTHLRHHHGLSPDQAATEVNQRIEVWMRQFLELQARLPDELDQIGCETDVREQALRCAEAFRVQWLGNVGWHLSVPRYREIRFRPN